MLLFYIFRN